MSCTIHTDLGPLLLVNWYRPPDDDATLSMPVFRKDLTTLVENHVGTIVMGDLNIHHRKWLRFSNANTPSGRALQQICDDASLQQLVRAPTRKEYLLDLILSDLEALLNVEVLAPIADHSLVLMVVDINTVSSEASKRDVWVFKRAKWQPLKTQFAGIRGFWKRFFSKCRHTHRPDCEVREDPHARQIIYLSEAV